MAILIGDQDNIFSVKGEINQENSKVLKHYVESQFKRFKNVIMNIDAVSKIDKNGFAALSEIHQQSLEKGNIFLITGIGCKEIYDDFHLSY